MKTHKSLRLSIILLLLASFTISAQTKEPQLLKHPNNWRFEKINFPLDFAPSINYTGYEELRFAPGMFETDAPYYFTYIFALYIKEKEVLSAKELETFLLKYYRGLCDAVAQPKKMMLDTSLINVELTALSAHKYHADLIFFDAFTTGQKINVLMEIDLFKGEAGSSYLLALVSPALKDGKQWNELYAIRDKLLGRKNFYEK